MRSGLAAAATAVLLLAAACSGDGYGGDDDGSDDTTEGATDVFDRDACELLSDEQVADVLGDDVDEESTPGDASTSQPAGCTWSVPDATVDFADPQATGVTVFLGDEQ